MGGPMRHTQQFLSTSEVEKKQVFGLLAVALAKVSVALCCRTCMHASSPVPQKSGDEWRRRRRDTHLLGGLRPLEKPIPLSSFLQPRSLEVKKEVSKARLGEVLTNAQLLGGFGPRSRGDVPQETPHDPQGTPHKPQVGGQVPQDLD
jgi:hypothetical protein